MSWEIGWFPLITLAGEGRRCWDSLGRLGRPRLSLPSGPPTSLRCSQGGGWREGGSFPFPIWEKDTEPSCRPAQC